MGDRLHDGDRLGDPGCCGDPGEEGLVESRFPGADLQAALTRHVIQAVLERLQDPVVGQADGENHRHAQRDAEDGDQRPQPVAREGPPDQEANEVQEG